MVRPDFKVGDRVVTKYKSLKKYFNEKDFYVVEGFNPVTETIELTDDHGTNCPWSSEFFDEYAPEYKEGNVPTIETDHLTSVMRGMLEMYNDYEKVLIALGAYVAGYEKGYRK